MIDLFDKQICVDCGKPCHFGSGRFVNRYPAYNDDKEGYRCGNCAYKVEKLYEEEDDE
tara:strand:- start:299 stop:472 length:174 start_codon:yes stop_codon:yes gene_type:complete